MIYLYDRAICKDLMQSFNPDNVDNPVVRVIDPEGSIAIAAQINDDSITYPIVVLERTDDIVVDADRYNFTRAKKGVTAGFDKVKNNFYFEKALPVKLDYTLTAITANQVDMDEIIRELLFKYSDMYFLTIETPYEVKRKIRFGIKIAAGSEIHTESANFDYISAGKLYESNIKLECEGCVLLSYTPQHLKRLDFEIKDTEHLL